MNVPAIKKFCAALPHATGDIKWGVDQVYSIGGRMFCVAFVDTKERATVSFKVDDDLFLAYTDRAGFIPAPYGPRKMGAGNRLEESTRRRIEGANQTILRSGLVEAHKKTAHCVGNHLKRPFSPIQIIDARGRLQEAAQRAGNGAYQP